MKIFKQHPLLGVCLLLYVFAFGLYTQKEEVKSLSDYSLTSEIVINDGNTGNISYYVNVSTVENALNDLNIQLQEEDTLNLALNHELVDGDIIEITRVTYEEERKEVNVPFATQFVESKDATLVGTKVITQGVNGTKDILYTKRMINGEEVSREETGSEITLDPVTCVIETGTVTTGEIVTGHLTSYGADCIGCGTRTAAGLYVTINGVKDERKATLSFNGGEYYVLAADPKYPFGTIVKISNHNYSIPDPFYGIVLDRGGAVRGNTMDVFSGSQKAALFSGSSSKVTIEIIQYGDGRTSIY